LLLGISGDQAMHLLWRLQNGEGPSKLKPKAITLMIGTNDAFHLTRVLPVGPCRYCCRCCCSRMGMI
jgi:lysophospholipase L1-like esterase